MNETYTPPTILVVEEDDEVRPVLSQNLRHHGYHVVVAVDESFAPSVSNLQPALSASRED